MTTDVRFLTERELFERRIGRMLKQIDRLELQVKVWGLIASLLFIAVIVLAAKVLGA